MSIYYQDQQILTTYLKPGCEIVIQKYLPKQLIRDNANLIVLFKQDETNLKHVYNEHCSGDMTYMQFKQHFCFTCWSLKAKEKIKQKHIELKTGEANVEQLFSQTFKPIIDPLIKISCTTQSESNEKNNKESNFDENYQQEIENWFHSTDFDKSYGPKKLSDGNISLGEI
ncbi:tigger transposable element-derived protein 4-like [Aphis craccivora]|uniref:Tigger transposable element-derived protein 4-like n=1 Tax=Aphis craccivora TaxID=307492 RepID=A0A6G0YA04_APHCR|nr:tigger transposable element-derived protein 4-like [Aphis craccivora]